MLPPPRNDMEVMGPSQRRVRDLTYEQMFVMIGEEQMFYLRWYREVVNAGLKS